MGYACPVCATPQRDGEHLAHHLAFTAMLHGDDHEAWLDEHASGWNERSPSELAETVVPHAEAAEYHEVFEDTVDRGRPDVGGYGQGHGHEHGHGPGHEHGHESGTRTGGRAERGGGVDGMDPETAAAIREARELTREMYEDDSDEAEDDSDEAEDDSDEADADDPAA